MSLGNAIGGKHALARDGEAGLGIYPGEYGEFTAKKLSLGGNAIKDSYEHHLWEP